MPKEPMSSVGEIRRYIRTKKHGGETWVGMAQAPDRPTMNNYAKRIRALGARCRCASIPDTGTFGYPERFAIIMPDGWHKELKEGCIDGVWGLLEEMDQLC